jgi:hypothetical protein
MLKGVGSIKLLLANPYFFIYVMRDLFAWARRSSSMSSRLREYREIFAAYLETVSTKKRKEKRGKSSQSSRKFSGRSGDSDSEDSAGSSSSSSGSDSSGSGNNEAKYNVSAGSGISPLVLALWNSLCIGAAPTDHSLNRVDQELESVQISTQAAMEMGKTPAEIIEATSTHISFQYNQLQLRSTLYLYWSGPGGSGALVGTRTSVLEACRSWISLHVQRHLKPLATAIESGMEATQVPSLANFYMALLYEHVVASGANNNLSSSRPSVDPSVLANRIEEAQLWTVALACDCLESEHVRCASLYNGAPSQALLLLWRVVVSAVFKIRAARGIAKESASRHHDASMESRSTLSVDIVARSAGLSFQRPAPSLKLRQEVARAIKKDRVGDITVRTDASLKRSLLIQSTKTKLDAESALQVGSRSEELPSLPASNDNLNRSQPMDEEEPYSSKAMQSKEYREYIGSLDALLSRRSYWLSSCLFRHMQLGEPKLSNVGPLVVGEQEFNAIMTQAAPKFTDGTFKNWLSTSAAGIMHALGSQRCPSTTLFTAIGHRGESTEEEEETKAENASRKEETQEPETGAAVDELITLAGLCFDSKAFKSFHELASAKWSSIPTVDETKMQFPCYKKSRPPNRRLFLSIPHLEVLTYKIIVASSLWPSMKGSVCFGKKAMLLLLQHGLAVELALEPKNEKESIALASRVDVRS